MKTILIAMLALLAVTGSTLASNSASDWASTATSEELQEVKGIGPVISQRIQDAAPFSSDRDLKDRVKGVGPVLLRRMTEKAKGGSPSPPKN